MPGTEDPGMDDNPKPGPGADEPMADDGQMHDSAWKRLPVPERAAHVARTIAAGRYLELIDEHDDAVMDLMAAVRAVREDNIFGLAMIVKHGTEGEMLVAAIKLLAELADEQHISSEFLTVWSAFAMGRA